MPAAHPGFPANGLKFLEELADHNTSPWFQKNKQRYDTLVKRPFVELIGALNDELDGFAPAYRVALPKGVSRPNRDTRFSADKSPYRTDISVVMPRHGLEKQLAAGFFLRVRADGADIIGGSVVPGPEQLASIRAYIARHHARVTSTTAKPALRRLAGELRGEQLVRVPKEFAADHPAADLLRRKQYYFERSLPRAIVSGPRFLREVVTTLRAMTPVVEMLDAAIGNR